VDVDLDLDVDLDVDLVVDMDCPSQHKVRSRNSRGITGFHGVSASKSTSKSTSRLKDSGRIPVGGEARN